SFPTRRSSDLGFSDGGASGPGRCAISVLNGADANGVTMIRPAAPDPPASLVPAESAPPPAPPGPPPADPGVFAGDPPFPPAPPPGTAGAPLFVGAPPPG